MQNSHCLLGLVLILIFQMKALAGRIRESVGIGPAVGYEDEAGELVLASWPSNLLDNGTETVLDEMKLIENEKDQFVEVLDDAKQVDLLHHGFTSFSSYRSMIGLPQLW